MRRNYPLLVAGATLAALAGLVATSGATAGSATAAPADGGRRLPQDPPPAGFRANALTWLTATRGWTLGTAPCGDSTCTDVLRTTDGGGTWRLRGSLPAPIANLGNGTGGVAEVRFGTRRIGWAFGPRLFSTSDGGATWTRVTIPGSGRQVLDLAASGRRTYAVVSRCRYGQGLCDAPLTFWRTTASGAWKRVPLDLPDSVYADVSAYGRTVYVIDDLNDFGGTDRFYASTDGRHFEPRPVACNNEKSVSLIQAVPTTTSDVAILCVDAIGSGDAYKKVYRSADTAETFRSAGAMDFLGIQSQLAATRSGNLAVASYSIGSFIYVNDGGGRRWSMPVGLGDGGLGWNDIVYTTNRIGWVVYAPVGLFDGPGQLYRTTDAGEHWQPVPIGS